EKSTAQPLPTHSWKRIGPSVVCASKSGASSPSRITHLLKLGGGSLSLSRSSWEWGQLREYPREVLGEGGRDVDSHVRNLDPFGMQRGSLARGQRLSV